EQLAKVFPEERRKHVYVFNEALGVLDQLKGKYKLLVLTNGSPDLQWEQVSLSQEIPPYFDHVVISGAFGRGKPDPAIFRHALELLSVRPEEAMMVGDNPMTDILGAQKTGMPSVWFNWDRRKKPDTVCPTYEITNLAELPEVVP